MIQEPIILFVKSCEEEYRKMVGIDDFPDYSIISKEMGLQKAQQEGFDSVAAAFYDIQTGKHTLEIWSRLYLPQMNAKYVVFHEFTHIWDAAVYSQQDKMKNMSNKGYTEYHAAQIEFMKLLGAENIGQQLSFSMKQVVETIGGAKEAAEFVEIPRKHAISLIRRLDFPASIETLAVTMGLIFNYYGRRSICKMYASDFSDIVDNSVLEDFLGAETIKALNNYMLGWFDANRVSLIDVLYGRMILSLAQKNGLG